MTQARDMRGQAFATGDTILVLHGQTWTVVVVVAIAGARGRKDPTATAALGRSGVSVVVENHAGEVWDVDPRKLVKVEQEDLLQLAIS